MKGLFEELRRRHVYRVAVVYIVMSWLVLQVGDIVLGILDTPAWVMKALLALLVLGFPLAVVLAWAFELTSDGVRRTEPLDSPEARAPEDRRRVGRGLNIALGTALVAALAFIGWQYLSTPTTLTTTATDADAPVDARASIAVLPLANSSGDPAQDYFSDGLSEELISGLSLINNLKVIGRSSSFQFKGTNAPATEIAGKLGVEHLLEGSVRQQGERVRIMVSLVRAIDGSTLWTQTFDRKLDDIFAVQSEIAQAVAAALQVELAPAAAGSLTSDQPPSGNIAAYQAYLQGRMYGRRNDVSGFRTSIQFHREALRLDPDYPSAYLGLVLSLVNLSGRMPLQEAQALEQQARDAVVQIKATAPGHLATLVAEFYVMQAVEHDYDRALAVAERAHALAPNHSDVLAALGGYYGYTGQPERSLEYTRRALAVDPLRLRWRANLVPPLITLGRLDEAESEIRQVLATDAQYPLMHSALADIGALRGDAAMVRKAAEDEPDADGKRYAFALAHAVDGNTAAFEAALRQLLGECSDGPVGCSASAASLAAFARQPDRAFELLEQASQDPRYRPFLGDAFLAPYVHDPRYSAHLSKYGMSLPSPVSQSATRH